MFFSSLRSLSFLSTYGVASLRLFACAVTVLAGCQAFDRAEFARLTGRGDGGQTTQPDGGGGDAACAERMRDIGDGCVLAVVPSPPPGLRNAPDPLRAERVWAARTITVGAGGMWQTIGFDRDGMCSTSSPSSPTPCRAAVVQADGLNGRDNTFGAVIGSGSVLGSDLDDRRLNASIARGSGTIGLRLRDFGGPNDGAIDVEILPLVLGHAAGDPSARPVWDGRDVWSIDRNLAYRADGRTIRIKSSDGFTSCGTLVVSFPSTEPLYFSNELSRSTLSLTEIRMVGSLDASNNLSTVDLSAIWARDQLFDDLRTFGICESRLSPLSWQALQFAVAAALDLPASGVVNPAVECSAMSLALRIELVPITLGPDASPPPPPIIDPCAPDAGVPPDVTPRG